MSLFKELIFIKKQKLASKMLSNIFQFCTKFYIKIRNKFKHYLLTFNFNETVNAYWHFLYNHNTSLITLILTY